MPGTVWLQPKEFFTTNKDIVFKSWTCHGYWEYLRNGRRPGKHHQPRLAQNSTLERDLSMEMDPNSLERIKAFIEFIQQAKQDNVELSFLSTPTEHGDNINVMANINGQRVSHGIVFWDLNLLQERGLVDTLDEEDKALGLNVTDGIVEDTEKILAFVTTEMRKSVSP
jgi:hypothetical protein